MDDAEDGGSMIETVAAKHGSCGYFMKIGKLVQDKILETVVLRCHALSGFASGNHSYSDRQRDVRSLAILPSCLSNALSGFLLLWRGELRP